MQLIGEYVIEILEIIYQNINHLNTSVYKKFLEQNPVFYKITRQRVQTYWNCYYRFGDDDISKYTKKDYLEILNVLDKLSK